MITAKEFQAMGVERGLLMKLEDAENAILDMGRRAVGKSNNPMRASTPAIGLEQFQAWDINRLCGVKK